MDEGDNLNPEAFEFPSDIAYFLSDDFNLDNIGDAQQHACTHTHTCNPPGPDLPHTHSCLHVHTMTFPSPTHEPAVDSAQETPKKRHCNREAVRKYRKKQKAKAASQEEELSQLRAENGLLKKRLKRFAALKSEKARLKHLLVDLERRINAEIGPFFPYQKPWNMSQATSMAAQVSNLGNPRSLQRHDQAHCFRPGMQGKNTPRGRACTEVGIMQCAAASTSGSKGFWGCEEFGTVLPVDCEFHIGEGEVLPGEAAGCWN